MKNTSKQLLLTLLLTATLNAEESVKEKIDSLSDLFTRTNITFGMGENGNLSIFVPIYYGSENQFFSGIGFKSENLNEVNTLDNFSDSKNSFVSNSKDLLVNYISYSTSFFGLKMSVGAESTFSRIENNEFGYIYDNDNILGNGADYYASFDNSIALDVQRHAIRADIELPIGSIFKSRLSTSISPYTQISVDQSTIFKPLSNETGNSSNLTVQDISYNLVYEVQVGTGTFFDIGFVASYDNTPYKYDLAQLDTDGSSYFFTTNTVDTNEITTSYLVKILFEKDIIGELNPSFGYGITNLDTKDNVNGTTVSTKNTAFTFGIEKRF